MVPMTMREHDALDDAKIDAELTRIAHEGVGLRPGIEQNGVSHAVAMGGDQARQAMIGAANALAGKNAHAFAIQIPKLGLDMAGNAGEAVGRVVDQDVNF